MTQLKYIKTSGILFCNKVLPHDVYDEYDSDVWSEMGKLFGCIDNIVELELFC